MKHSFFILFVIMSFTTDVLAQNNAQLAGVTQLTARPIFPPESDVKWYTEGKLDKMVFYRDSTTIHVYMNRKGAVVRVVRYYTDISELPIFVLAKLVERFPGYLPFAVTEEHNEAGINYLVNISNGLKWMQVHADVNGKFTIMEKYLHPQSQDAEAQLSNLP